MPPEVIGRAPQRQPASLARVVIYNPVNTSHDNGGRNGRTDCPACDRRCHCRRRLRGNASPGAAQPAAPPDTGVYFPDAAWQHREPSEAGLKPQLLQQAIDFAIANETRAPRDLVMNHYQTFGREPFGYAVGPIKERGSPTGLIIRRGYIVAEWGEPCARRHDPQRLQELPLLGDRRRFRPRHDQEHRRPGEGLCGAD